MALRIGFIGPVEAIDIVKSYNINLENEISILYLPYSKLSDINELCTDNLALVDAFLFSGELPYLFVSKKISEYKKPCYFLPLPREELYKLLLSLVVNNKDIDFSRIYIDFISIGYNCMGLDDIIPKNKFPYTFPHDMMEQINQNVNDGMDDEELEQIFKFMKSTHIDLFKKNKIDISITRIGNIVKNLRSKGLTTYYLFPGKSTTIHMINTIKNNIKLQSLENTLCTIGNISIYDTAKNISIVDNEANLKQVTLYKALIDYSLSNGIPYSIQNNGFNIEIYISKGLLMELTGNYTHCSLLEYIKNTLPYKVNIGWGIGFNIKDARENAENANQNSARSGGNCSFIITESKSIIGPLSEMNCLQYDNSKDEYIEELSLQTGLSSLTLKKLTSVMDKLNTDELSSKDVACYLGITERSANRILSKLLKGGFVSASYKTTEKLIGRPKRIYKFHFGR